MSGPGAVCEVIRNENFHLAPEHGVERFFAAYGAFDPLHPAETRRRPLSFENKYDFDYAVRVCFDGEPQRIAGGSIRESRTPAPRVAGVAAFAQSASIRLELLAVNRVAESSIWRAERQARRLDPRPVINAIDGVEIRAGHESRVAR